MNDMWQRWVNSYEIEESSEEKTSGDVTVRRRVLVKSQECAKGKTKQRKKRDERCALKAITSSVIASVSKLSTKSMVADRGILFPLGSRQC